MVNLIDQKGILFIEVMISILLISILASVSIPLYNARVVRVRLNEVTESLELVRVGLMDYRKLHGSFPNCGDAVIIRNSLGVSVYVGGVSRIKKISVENGLISCTIQNVGFGADDHTLDLTPLVDVSTDGVIWRYSGTLVTDPKTQSFSPKR